MTATSTDNYRAVTSENFRAVVLSRYELSPVVSGCRFRVLGLRPFVWIAGQYLLLSTDDAPELGVPFSIASTPDGLAPGEFELAISNVGSRELVSKLEPGRELTVSAARGSFIYLPSAGATMLVGIGTGLAPLRAMLQAALAVEESDPVVLLYGARRETDVLWRDELEALARAHPRFHFEPTLSASSAAHSGRRGRVQDHLRELTLPLHAVSAYVCGTRPMVDDCVRILMGELSGVVSRVAGEAF